jgi:GT2 family glycosyltransferase
LIICDDGSMDSTSQVVAQLLEDDRRIRYTKNTARQGLPANRNIGISKARASLILFIEDDVILEPDCVAILVDTFKQLSEQHKVGAVAPSRPDEWLVENGTRRGVLEYAWRASNKDLAAPCTVRGLTGVIHYNFVPSFGTVQEVPSVHACSLYRAEALREVGGYDSSTYRGNYLYEEADLNIQLTKIGYRLFFQPEAVMHHQPVYGGGCRVDTMRYAYYFALNHTKFLLKNFGFRSVWMVPSFFLATGFVALRALAAYAIFTPAAE